LGSLPLREAAPVSEPGYTIRKGGGGVVAELPEAFRCEFLSFGAFTLAAERSFLSVCLAAVVSESSKILPGLVDTEENFDLRGWEETPFEGT